MIKTIEAKDLKVGNQIYSELGADKIVIRVTHEWEEAPVVSVTTIQELAASGWGDEPGWNVDTELHLDTKKLTVRE